MIQHPSPEIRHGKSIRKYTMLIWLNSPETHSGNFVFLDRDGVINVDRPGYIKRWGEFQFYPDALEALQWLHKRNVNVILISNQSALNRGLISCEDFWYLHEQMILRIRKTEGDLLATFYCPHRPDENCSCRKPSPGMILAASRIYEIDLRTAAMIGDKTTDMLAAGKAGCHRVLLQRSGENGASSKNFRNEGDIQLYSTLMEAVASIFGK